MQGWGTHDSASPHPIIIDAAIRNEVSYTVAIARFKQGHHGAWMQMLEMGDPIWVEAHASILVVSELAKIKYDYIIFYGDALLSIDQIFRYHCWQIKTNTQLVFRFISLKVKLCPFSCQVELEVVILGSQPSSLSLFLFKVWYEVKSHMDFFIYVFLFAISGVG